MPADQGAAKDCRLRIAVDREHADLGWSSAYRSNKIVLWPSPAQLSCCRTQPVSTIPTGRSKRSRWSKTLRKPSVRWASCGPAIPSNQLQKSGERIIVVPTVGWLAPLGCSRHHQSPEAECPIREGSRPSEPGAPESCCLPSACRVRLCCRSMGLL